MIGFVYFIMTNAGEDLRVKVGHTTQHPTRRLRALQTGSAFPLRLLGYIPGTMQQEKALHGVLNNWRVVGEWFSFEGDCREAIEHLIEVYQ